MDDLCTETDQALYTVEAYISTAGRDNPSDHMPVSLCIRPRAAPGSRGVYKVPEWVLENSERFSRTFHYFWSHCESCDCPFEEMQVSL